MELLRAAEPITNSVGLRLVPIPAGKFQMGSPKDQPGRRERETLHEVEITRPFYIGSCEVTQRQYAAVMGKNPSRFGQAARETKSDAAATFDDHPADSITWPEAVAFCEKLSALEEERTAKRKYRLPTEAEWEYAARAGATGLWSFGDDKSLLAEHAWYRRRGSELVTHPVAQKKPNAWGLYDVHGNVWEWCSDWYAEDYYKVSPARDPAGPREGVTRVIRGGAYQSVPAHTRCASRFHDPPQVGDEDVGFRVVLELE